jgi:hypothetical protein
MGDGDLCLTVLDSDPPLVVLLERLAAVGSRSVRVHHAECLNFSDPIPIPALNQVLGRELPAAPSTLENDFADEVLSALVEFLDRPPHVSCRETSNSVLKCRFRHSGLRAAAVLRSNGRCEGCGRNFGVLLEGAGVEALEAHYVETLAQSRDETVEIDGRHVAAVCVSCHRLLHAHTGLTIEDLRTASAQSAHPACPSCGAHRTFRLQYGLTFEPAAPGVYDVGCSITGDDPEWLCAACNLRWGSLKSVVRPDGD